MTDTVSIESLLATLPSEEELVAKCLELGLIMRRPPLYDITHPAITLFPSTVQAGVLHALYAKQLLWNEAIDRTARNFAFLQSALRETAASDKSFTGRLLQMLEDVYVSPPALPEGAGVVLTHAVFQPLMLGIFRSDYMRAVGSRVDAADPLTAWKHVEVNTISCSFAGLSPLVGQFHRYLQKYRNVLLSGRSDADRTHKAHNATSSVAAERHDIVNNGTIEESLSGAAIPSALASAVEGWKAVVPFKAFVAHAVGKAAAAKTPAAAAGAASADEAEIPLQPVVLVVIQENERNTGDQYKLLFELLAQHGVISIRRTLTQLHESMTLSYFDASGASPGAEYASAPFAVVEQKYVVAVAYFRSTYVPEDFPTEACWASREQLERSNAIKCPSIPYHLLTFKKLQQLFCDERGVLTPIAFAGNADKATQLAAHFVSQYSLNKHEYTAEMLAATEGKGPEKYIDAAIEHPEAFVLKPQLEGGGNLIAGESMQQLLRDNRSESDAYYHRIRQEFILMEKIPFEKKDGLLFRQSQTLFFGGNACSELGIFGCVLSDGSDAVHDHSSSSSNGNGSSPLAALPVSGKVFSRHGGYIVRTKPAAVDDGGVMAGVACLDSMLLVD